MKFCLIKKRITPDSPIFEAGFAGRTRKKSIGVNDEIYTTIAILQSNKTVVIIALDLLHGNRAVANGIKKEINEKYGLMQDQIIISYSHTHSVTGLKGEKDNNIENVRYYNIVKSKIMNALDEGFENLIEGDAYISKSKSKFGVSRRFPSEQGILWKPNSDENAIDMDLYLIKFVDKNGNMCGLIYNYACHPTTLGPDNFWISADYPGIVRKYLEKANKGIIPLFLQGCGADAKPYITAYNGEFRSCNLDELEQAGKSLANEIQEIIDGSWWRKIDVDIKTGCSEIKLYTEIWDPQKWEDIANNPDEPTYKREAAENVLSYIKEKGLFSLVKEDSQIKNYQPYYMSYLRLDSKTCIICLENEVINEIGKKIKKLFKDEDIIVLAYTNSSAMYIPSKKAIREGGYETGSFIWSRLTGPFVPEVEDTIVGLAAQMIKTEL